MLVWRVALGPAIRGKSGVRTKNPMRGFPDLAGIVPGTAGQLFAIEVKKPKQGRLSEEQEVWISRLSERGVLTIVARSLDDVMIEFNQRRTA